MAKHPRDRYLTVYGRKPVLEVLLQPDLVVDKVLLTHRAKAPIVDQIEAACARKGIPLHRVAPAEVSRLSKHPKQDQGAVADVCTPHMDDALQALEQPLPDRCRLLALDGITTPANLGLIIRTATALGIDGILLPRKGSAKLDAFVIKASAGVVFRSAIWKCERLTPVLKKAHALDFAIYALSGEQGSSLYETTFAERAIFVLGNETHGVTPQTEALVTQHLTIPMANGVESLNVACAAAVVLGELARRG